MDIANSYTFAASPDRVWALLMAPAVIGSCIPGCNQLDPDGEDRYRATVTIALSAITGKYTGTVVITEKVAPNSYRLTAEGQGHAGFAKGSVVIALRAEGATTIVDVTGTVETGGAIARLGQRLIGSVMRMMQDRFFACLQSKIQPRILTD